MSLPIRNAIRRLPTTSGLKATRTFTSTSSTLNPYPNTTLHTTNNVHSLGHSIEHNPKANMTTQASSSHAGVNAAVSRGIGKEDGVWCVVGASSGETSSKFRGVPMGAYAVSDTFGPAWRRSQ